MIGQISAQTSFEPASNQPEPAGVMEFGFNSDHWLMAGILVVVA